MEWLLRSAAPRWAKAGGTCSPQDYAGVRLVHSLSQGFQPRGSCVPTLPETACAGGLCQSHWVPEQHQHPAPSPYTHQHRAQGSILRGRTRPISLPLHWCLAGSSGHAQSKTTDTMDFTMPVLHTHLYKSPLGSFNSSSLAYFMQDEKQLSINPAATGL